MPQRPAAPGPPAADGSRRWRRRALLAAVVVSVVVLAVAVGASALPRWWAQRVGDQVDGDLTTGVWVGFMYGLAASLLPLLVLGLVARFFRRRRLAWGIGVPVALVLAAPNLLTLGIAFGSGSAAHAADRTLDVEAPWFRGGMLIGAIVGVAGAGLLLFALVTRRRARRAAGRMRAELEASKAARPPE